MSIWTAFGSDQSECSCSLIANSVWRWRLGIIERRIIEELQMLETEIRLRCYRKYHAHAATYLNLLASPVTRCLVTS
jgi:hypothetical protein